MSFGSSSRSRSLLPRHDLITGATSFRHAREKAADTSRSRVLGEELARICAATPHDRVIGAVLLGIRFKPELLQSHTVVEARLTASGGAIAGGPGLARQHRGYHRQDYGEEKN